MVFFCTNRQSGYKTKDISSPVKGRGSKRVSGSVCNTAEPCKIGYFSKNNPLFNRGLQKTNGYLNSFSNSAKKVVALTGKYKSLIVSVKLEGSVFTSIILAPFCLA